jgi:CheY-like chemotaxis protein
MSERTCILLVDDQPENLLTMEAILEPLGHELVRAGSGEEALRRLLHDEFALILLDARMPGMDGFETAALIKRRERTRDIPIIFITGVSTDPSHVFRGYSQGAVDYIFKPVNPSILRSKVRVFVELKRAEAEFARARAELELRRAARRQALELNDNVLQGLAIAKYALAAGNATQVAQAIEQTLANVRQIVDHLVGSEGLRAGDLRRDRPALSRR